MPRLSMILQHLVPKVILNNREWSLKVRILSHFNEYIVIVRLIKSWYIMLLVLILIFDWFCESCLLTI
jgi:hypothetical protein